MENINKIAIEKAIEESKMNMSNDYSKGGPFGAVIVKDDKILCSAHNTVIQSKDPTAHAEINAIREAAKILNSHDLTGCTLYTNAEPCPMCLSAIIWSNIKIVYYINTKKDVDKIGFRDDIIYEYLKGNNNEIIKLIHVDNKEAIKVFEEYEKLKDKNIY